MEKILEVKHLTKVFKNGVSEIYAVKDMTFDVSEGELVIILGPSGAGKSTLLNLIGGMENATEGELIVDGENIINYNKKQLALYRRDKVGFVFQFYNLMSNLTALENVELSTDMKKDSMDPVEALKMTGLKYRMNSFPSQLSGGEQQRVSIARAIAKNPSILLCDEPTGALDYRTGKKILKILQNIAKEQHKAVIIVTHNSALQDMGDKIIKIKNGKIEELIINETTKDIEEIVW